MKRSFFFPFIFSMILVLAACNDNKDKDKDKGKVETKETPASIAQAWCDLNGKYSRAAEGAEKDAAKDARKKFEDDMDAKYEKDSTFYSEIMKEVEKCESASEEK